MRRVVATAVIGLVMLTACGREEAPETSAPVIEAPEANTSIGFGAAAGIAEALPMTIEAISSAAPAFIVAEAADEIEGDPFTAITLSLGDEEVFRIYPTADRTRIHAVVTHSSQARGPAGDIVGLTRFGAAPPEEVGFCLAEYVGGAAGFACSNAEDGRFWRVYRTPEGYDGPGDPFDAIDPDVLHDSLLVEMRWIAPRA
jgi:hypothetical protein